MLLLPHDRSATLDTHSVLGTVRVDGHAGAYGSIVALTCPVLAQEHNVGNSNLRFTFDPASARTLPAWFEMSPDEIDALDHDLVPRRHDP